ncbi:MAG: glucose-6-phosphate isomerase [Campylobacteraceae bacterium]|nr:glucose-6-phosphate isomerase [Campylobacteraceae bacterium]
MEYKKNFYEIRSNNTIFKSLEKELDNVGYYSLPEQDIKEVIDFAKDVKQKDIAIIGIGGSTLGTYAIHKFLKTNKKSNKKLHFFESTDPTDIKSRLDKLDLRDTLFLVISKSGTTIETISIFKYLSSLINIDKSNCVIISEVDSKLTSFAKINKIKTFDIPKNVGGRFSVFSNVGLVPLAIIGVNIKELLLGAKEVKDSFFDKKDYYNEIFNKARFLVENKKRFNINVLFSYSSSLEGFNKWYVQLWGESLGKLNINGTKQSLTPIGLIGPVDQHSFLQLIVEGNRNKTVTFIKVEDFEDETEIPANTLKGFDDLDYIDNVKFQDLLSAQAASTIQSIQELKDIPYDVITMLKQDEKNIAKLMFTFQLLTSVVGKFFQIDTYNQPGVERGKIILKDKLKGDR